LCRPGFFLFALKIPNFAFVLFLFFLKKATILSMSLSNLNDKRSLAKRTSDIILSCSITQYNNSSGVHVNTRMVLSLFQIISSKYQKIVALYLSFDVHCA
jgi:hypothetical protein